MPSKSIILLSATIFGIIGSYVPTWLGDHELLSGWSILGGMVGGFFGIFFGIWFAVWLGKKLS